MKFFKVKQITTAKNLPKPKKTNLIFAFIFLFLFSAANVSFVANAQSLDVNTNLNVDQSLLPANTQQNSNASQASASTQSQTSTQSQKGTQDLSQPTTKTTGNEYKEIGGVTYLVANLSSKAIAIIAGFLQYPLYIGNKAASLESVKTAWQIVLNFTNLGFVLAIIVMAFATILRIDSYGMKTILWKLIVAALLVNFSLVIAGAIVSVSAALSDIFLQATSSANIGDALANAFQPQSFWEVKELAGWDLLTGGLSYFIQFISDTIFIFIFNALMILVILALFIMLLARAVAMIVLVILSPAIWLMWIFPQTQKYWEKWWNEFLRWNFFAPIVLFFIYLTVLFAQNKKDFEIAKNSAISAAEKDLSLSGVFVHGARLMILIGLLVVGLYVANMFGIAGASWAYSTAENAGKGAVGWAKRKGIQSGTWMFRKKFGEEGKEKSFAERASEGAAKASQRLNQNKFLKYSGLAYLASHAVGGGAKGVAKLAASGEALTKQAKDSLKGKSLNELIAMYGYADAPTRIAIEQDLAEKDLLGKIPNFAKDFYAQKTKNTYLSYGQGKAYGDIEKSIGTTLEMHAAAINKDSKALKEATEKLVKSYDDKSAAKIDWKAKYSKYPLPGLDEETNEMLRGSFTKTMSEISPGYFAKGLRKFNDQHFDIFKKTIAKLLPEEVEVAVKEKIKVDTGEIDREGKIIYKEEIKEKIIKKKREDLSDEELLDAIKNINPKLHKSLSKNFADRILGFAAAEGKEEIK